MRKGERGIAIIAPHTYKEKRRDTGEDADKIGFHLAYTYDVSQTDADDDLGGIPEICRRLTGDLADADLLATLTSISPVPVKFAPVPGEANGYYSTEHCEIVVDDTNSQTQQAKTLLHEIAHCRHHMIDPDFDDCPRPDKEVIAESCAYTVCSYLGIPTDDYSFGYLAGWGDRNLGELKRNLDLIRRISDAIISDLEASMDAAVDTA